MPCRFATAILLALASCGQDGGESAARVEDAVVTLPAVPGRPGAAYFTIESETDAVLTGVTSRRLERAELHNADMRPAARFPLSPNAPLVFAPGGRHAMLFGLDPALRPGQSVALTFSLEGRAPVTVEAEVRAPGDVHGGH